MRPAASRARDRPLRPDRRRQDRRRDRARRAPARTRASDPVAVSADALQVYRGLEMLTGRRRARGAGARSSTGCVSFLPVDADVQRRRSTPSSPTPRSTALLAAGRAADRGRRHRPVPARRARRPRPAPPPPDGVRERWSARARAPRPGGAARRLAQRAPWAARADRRPPTASRIVRALELLDAGRARAARAARTSCGPRETRHPTRLVGLVMDREALYARIDARVDAMVAAGAREEVPRRRRRRRLGDRAQGARLRRAADGRRRGDEAPHAQLRQAPADVDAQARPASSCVDVTGRDAGDVAGGSARRLRPPRARCARCASRSGRRSATTT